eukprot:scaffold1863_cov381-Prasinococcus_capsulatus_cf.AAC.3
MHAIFPAIYHGQDFAWHVDMDPLRVSYGPWVERYGWSAPADTVAPMMLYGIALTMGNCLPLTGTLIAGEVILCLQAL